MAGAGLGAIGKYGDEIVSIKPLKKIKSNVVDDVVESGKSFWKMLNGESIPVINPK